MFKKEYNDLTSKISKSISLYRNGNWNKFLESLENHPLSSCLFWSKINQVISVKQSSYILNLKVGELEYKSDQEKADLFSDVFKNTFSENEILMKRIK